MTIDEKLKQMYWRKDETYAHNYTKSIGCKNQTTGIVENIIDLENKTLYGIDTPIKFERHKEDGSKDSLDPVLSVSGSLYAGEFHTGNFVLSSDFNGYALEVARKNTGRKIVFRLKNKEDYQDLTEEQKNNCQTVATLGDFSELKNKVSLNKERLICVLDLLKYVPELADKVQEINEIINDLNDEVDG